MSLTKIRLSFSWSALVMGIIIYDSVIYLCLFPGLAIIIGRGAPIKDTQP